MADGPDLVDCLELRDRLLAAFRKNHSLHDGSVHIDHLVEVLNKLGLCEKAVKHIEAYATQTMSRLGDGNVEIKRFVDWIVGYDYKPLTVMSLNMQYFSSYPSDAEAGAKRLREVTGQTKLPPPDVICVQEGLEGRDEIVTHTGYRRIVSSADPAGSPSGEPQAQSVRDMVYGDLAALRAIPETAHDKLLVNEIYIRDGCDWEVVNRGVEQISSDIELQSGKDTGRVSGKLAKRTVVWVQLRNSKDNGNELSAFVLCMHVTGGRFEDNFFVQQLAEERRLQPERAIDVFRRRAKPGDVCCLVGDFNATTKYRKHGPMHQYFVNSLQPSRGVQADATLYNIMEDDLEPRFENYMVSPFSALQRSGWTLAYNEKDVGSTSAYGHVVDYMATSCRVPLKSETITTTNQRCSITGAEQSNTKVPITDHNAVKVELDLTDCFKPRPSSSTLFGADLGVMTLNMQYYASYPKDKAAGARRLREITGTTAVGPPSDVICVQEGLEGHDELGPSTNFAYRKLLSSGMFAQSITDMVYTDEAAMSTVEEEARGKLLVNEIYLRQDGAWEAVDSGVEQVSSDLQLDGGDGTGRVSGPLAVRSVVWVKLRPKAGPISGPFVFVLCTHLSGGRFEDQFYAQQLAKERSVQPQRAVGVFQWLAGPGDFCVLVGDFNATAEYAPDGVMHKYFTSSIENSEGVLKDLKTAGLERDVWEKRFADYMTAPFQALEECGWHMAYNETQVGATSGFGHLIDHMAMSCAVPVEVERLITTNQKFGAPKETDTPISDHNAVKARFRLPGRHDPKETSSLVTRTSAQPAKNVNRSLAYFTPGTRVEYLDASGERKSPARVVRYNEDTGLYTLDIRIEVPLAEIRWPTLKELHILRLPAELSYGRGLLWDRYFELRGSGVHKDERGFPHSLPTFIATKTQEITPQSITFRWGSVRSRECHRQEWSLGGAVLKTGVVRSSLALGSSDDPKEVFGFASPVFAVTFDSAEREERGIPANAQSFLWCYPMEGIVCESGHVASSGESQNILKKKTSFVNNNVDVAFLRHGGYVYFAASKDDPKEIGEIVRINALLVDGTGPIGFGPPRRMLPGWTEQLFQAGRFRPVTMEALRVQGATHFCWIRPLEKLGGQFMCQKGGFAYLFRRGEMLEDIEADGNLSSSSAMPGMQRGRSLPTDGQLLPNAFVQ